MTAPRAMTAAVIGLPNRSHGEAAFLRRRRALQTPRTSVITSFAAQKGGTRSGDAVYGHTSSVLRRTRAGRGV